MSLAHTRVFKYSNDGAVLRKIYAFLFKTLGWTIDNNNWPIPYKKYILVVAPHTSNWDFLVGLGARAVLQFNPRYIGKKELFVWPIGWLFRKLGGYPVERKVNTNLVQSLTEIFNKEEEFILTMTPEGTRSYNDQWKTGFYYLAKNVQIPMVPVGFDYKTKRVVVHEPIFAEKPVEDLIYELKTWFSQFEGKNPELGVRKPNKR